MSITHIKYQGDALPDTETVTLFDSRTAFADGSFHLLNQNWFQWSLVATGAAGEVTGSYINAAGSKVEFYSSATVDGTFASDEVPVSTFKDIVFEFTTAGTLTGFDPNLTLHCDKPTSKVSAADVLHDGTAAAGSINIVDVTPSG
ncbi:MAG TPA: hypothetical protein VKZ49_04655 [Polyangiaceae bacterium]|nr:hypothetical protein [Polyangiaceae bacterium]